MTSASEEFEKETLLPVTYRTAEISFSELIREAAGGLCRVGTWRTTAIVRARLKAVSGRLFEAYLRSVATALKGTRVPAKVTQPPGLGDHGGIVVTRAPLWRFEKL
jgi:hypothetical protein